MENSQNSLIAEFVTREGYYSELNSLIEFGLQLDEEKIVISKPDYEIVHSRRSIIGPSTGKIIQIIFDKYEDSRYSYW
jgi:hypothetical protein